MDFTLTITADDLDECWNPSTRRTIAGTVIAPALSPEPLAVSNGVFNLFVQPGAGRYAQHDLRHAADLGGRQDFFFHRVKDRHRQTTRPEHLAETTTLYVTVYRRPDQAAPVLGSGVLHIHPTDFLKQMTTMTATNAPNERERIEALVRFGKFFAGISVRAYGGVFAPEKYFNPERRAAQEAAAGCRRAGGPRLRHRGRRRLRLTRYRGGAKGPLLMVHGAGVSSSSIFSTDLIDTNMLEYLYAHAVRLLAVRLPGVDRARGVEGAIERRPDRLDRPPRGGGIVLIHRRPAPQRSRRGALLRLEHLLHGDARRLEGRALDRLLADRHQHGAARRRV